MPISDVSSLMLADDLINAVREDLNAPDKESERGLMLHLIASRVQLAVRKSERQPHLCSNCRRALYAPRADVVRMTDWRKDDHLRRVKK